mmetsp:Transcript_105906/g.299379  ORF Transcript_105906/g.299379 Transcript_105906/m.299379 type:complete len:366 (+) Transcript_105906:114-1211(+)
MRAEQRHELKSGDMDSVFGGHQSQLEFGPTSPSKSATRDALVPRLESPGPVRFCKQLNVVSSEFVTCAVQILQNVLPCSRSGDDSHSLVQSPTQKDLCVRASQRLRNRGHALTLCLVGIAAQGPKCCHCDPVFLAPLHEHLRLVRDPWVVFHLNHRWSYPCLGNEVLDLHAVVVCHADVADKPSSLRLDQALPQLDVRPGRHAPACATMEQHQVDVVDLELPERDVHGLGYVVLTRYVLHVNLRSNPDLIAWDARLLKRDADVVVVPILLCCVNEPPAILEEDLGGAGHDLSPARAGAKAQSRHWLLRTRDRHNLLAERRLGEVIVLWQLVGTHVRGGDIGHPGSAVDLHQRKHVVPVARPGGLR